MSDDYPPEFECCIHNTKYHNYVRGSDLSARRLHFRAAGQQIAMSAWVTSDKTHLERYANLNSNASGWVRMYLAEPA
jgi:hypothetical protein